jgi:hypothetical protein
MRRASRERYDDDAFQRFSRLLLKVAVTPTAGCCPGLWHDAVAVPHVLA